MYVKTLKAFELSAFRFSESALLLVEKSPVRVRSVVEQGPFSKTIQENILAEETVRGRTAL